jgi:tyrosyl-tRNA synthetase
MSKEEKIKNLLTRNVGDIIKKDHLENKLRSGRALQVKLGIDPTSSDLHLGHAVVLRKLKEFQDLGHKITLIIGDFTGRIGDPSGRDIARKPLTEADIRKNMKNYLAQAGKIIDVKKAEIRHNSEWFNKAGSAMIMKLASVGSMQQVLKRADFKKRLAEGNDITLIEVLYPLFQGYDSVAIKADVELGGTDQTFNLIMGRKVQRYFGLPEQDIMTLALLEGTDGVKKMSKSLGNYISLDDESENMFGKTMSLPDKLIEKYFLLCTDLKDTEIKSLTKNLKPRDLKARLGSEIVKIYHGLSAAKKSEEEFERKFSKKETLTANLPILKIANNKISATELVVKSGFTKSKSEAGRLVSQGGLKIGDKTYKDPREIITIHEGEVIKVGKKKFFRVKF